jgi:hypothetical protein
VSSYHSYGIRRACWFHEESQSRLESRDTSADNNHVFGCGRRGWIDILQWGLGITQDSCAEGSWDDLINESSLLRRLWHSEGLNLEMLRRKILGNLIKVVNGDC